MGRATRNPSFLAIDGFHYRSTHPTVLFVIYLAIFYRVQRHPLLERFQHIFQMIDRYRIGYTTGM